MCDGWWAEWSDGRMAGVWMGARVKVIVAVLDGILGLELEEGKAAKCDEEEGQMVEEVAVEERGCAAIGLSGRP